MSSTQIKKVSSTTNVTDESSLLVGSTLFFGLDYQNTKVKKSGLVARFKKQFMPMDIDLACLLFDEAGNCIEKVWFKNLRDSTEAIRHHGDQLRGRRDDHETQAIETLVDLEQIEIRLKKINPLTRKIALVVSSFTGHPLSQVAGGKVYIQDDEASYLANQDLTRLDKNTHTFWMATLTCHIEETLPRWQLKQEKTNISIIDKTGNLDKVADFISSKL